MQKRERSEQDACFACKHSLECVKHAKMQGIRATEPEM